MPEERYYHLATLADWEGAQGSGRYTTSTLGRSLDAVGYIHMSRADQVAATAAAFYASRDDVVLLEIDPVRLDAPVREDPVGTTTFPHLYGPLPVGAVVSVRPYRS